MYIKAYKTFHCDLYKCENKYVPLKYHFRGPIKLTGNYNNFKNVPIISWNVGTL